MIRRATAADANAIADLCGQLGYPTTLEQAAHRLNQFAAEESSPVFVNEVDGRVTAWIQLREASSMESGHTAEIIGLVVEEAHRGTGAGTALVEFSKGWARQRGHDVLRVRTNEVRTRTHAFYERLGFELKKTQRVYAAEVNR